MDTRWEDRPNSWVTEFTDKGSVEMGGVGVQEGLQRLKFPYRIQRAPF